MPKITLHNLTKRFGELTAVRLSATIRDGEFFVVVGPTGCGKTTLLKLIAGLLRPDEGEIYFDGKLMNKVKARDRGVRMVFQGQDYALYPHMRVFDEQGYSNLSFPLKLRRVGVDKIRGVVEGVTQRLGIGRELYERKPNQLSEGQKQRVAVGRAITLPPKVLLMDEPLSNLDPPSRATSRGEVRRLHNELKATTIYVTHDLAEAFILADRIAVMREGSFVQVGIPQEIRGKPSNEFVKEFVRSYEGLLREAFVE
jgi:ABC-type sugar transport system ATPase subunit